ncbi:MAG: head completion protein [uncultured marine phage]|uniref:Head completion nuclease n=1 Tax=uncultured marine phage TaxID=707152 RepID=A0A8D9C8T7_9VIRU|nr:MAG: head completion protein [uncultured marine phage]
MINNAPNNPRRKDGKRKYKQGNFIPDNKDKVIKLNGKGGIYYRSGYEFKIYRYFDLNPKVIKWGAEFIEIPYRKRSVKKTSWGEYQWKETDHRYYPDVYYELLKDDGTVSKVIGEIKPYSETKEPELKHNATTKQLENFEYSMNLWNANMFKWEQAIEYAANRGMKFVIISEKYIKMLKN